MRKTSSIKSIGVICALAACVFWQANSTWPQVYKVNGKSVGKNVYEAANLINAANSSYRSGLTDKAMGQLRMALSYDPSFAAAHSNLGVLLARAGKNTEALKHLKQAVSSPDAPAGAFAALATIYQSTGQIDEAIQTYQSFLQHTDSSERQKSAQAIIDLLKKERVRQQNSHGATEHDYFVNADGQYVTKAFWTKWHMPLKVYINPDVQNLDSYSSNYNTLLRQAFSDWSKASNGQITFRFVDSPEDCDIDCKWTDDPQELGSGSEDGQCESLSGAGTMAHSHVLLLCASRDSFPMTENNILNTCRHELGHALGIGWHSACPDDVMYFSASFADKEKPISARDAATLEKLYGTQLSPEAALLDFIRCSENRKRYFPLIMLASVVLAFAVILWRLAREKKNSKNRRKA